MSSAATAFLPLVAIWLTSPDEGGSWTAVQLSFVVVAVHLFAIAGILLADWRGVVPQLRGIARIQRRKWPICRPIYRIVLYRDSTAWWRAVAVLVFAPAGVFSLAVAYTVS